MFSEVRLTQTQTRTRHTRRREYTKMISTIVLIVIISSIVYQYFIIPFYLDIPYPCIRPIHAKPETQPECFFKDTYDESRAEFLRLAKLRNAEISSYPLGEGELQDYTIDFALFPGKSDSLVIQISGTHGTEGFAGSAIQRAILSNGFSKYPNPPTILMVHALNPFGMSQLRRVNENNVDLNRNAMLNPEEWVNVISKLDPNRAGYETISKFINPVGPPTFFGSLKNVVLALWTSYVNGYSIKKALVSGTYTNPKGIFFGGTSLQNSHGILALYLRSKDLFKKIKHLRIIDIHTGLGPMGEDSLLVMEDRNSPTYIALKKFDDSLPKEKRAFVVSASDATDGAGSGYDETYGTVPESFGKLFVNAKDDSIVLTQEFGTYQGVYVAFSMMYDNQAWHYARENRILAATMAKDAFNPNRRSFQTRVIQRGMILFDSIVQSM